MENKSLSDIQNQMPLPGQGGNSSPFAHVSPPPGSVPFEWGDNVDAQLSVIQPSNGGGAIAFPAPNPISMPTAAMPPNTGNSFMQQPVKQSAAENGTVYDMPQHIIQGLQAPVQASSAVAEPMASEPPLLTARDIYGEPEPEMLLPVMRSFNLNGKAKCLLISRDGLRDGDVFFRFAVGSGTAFEPLTCSYPNMKPFTVTEQAYLRVLHLLSELVISPKLSPEQWAIFGHKFGAYYPELSDEAKKKLIKEGKPLPVVPDSIMSIAAFVNRANGLIEKDVQEDEKGAGEPSNQDFSDTDLTEPVLPDTDAPLS